MPLKMKVLTLSLLWVAIISTAFLTTDSPVIRIILAAVLIGVTIHIITVKPKRRM